MLTSSIVLYKNSLTECHTIIDCLLAGNVDKIYLVDHSGNDSLSILKDYSPKIEYIAHANLGYGSGHNVAIKKAIDAGAAYHIVLNADLKFSADVLPKLTDFMNQTPDAGLVMPQVYYPDGRNQQLCKLLPTPFDLFARRFFPKSWFKKSKERFYCNFTGYDRIMNVPYLSGCFMFLRISTLKDVGLFDERFFMYAEDIDLSRRIHQKYQTIFFPAASIIHDHKAASGKNFKMLLIHLINVSRYFNKYGWFFDKERNLINKTFVSSFNNQTN